MNKRFENFLSHLDILDEQQIGGALQRFAVEFDDRSVEDFEGIVEFIERFAQILQENSLAALNVLKFFKKIRSTVLESTFSIISLLVLGSIDRNQSEAVHLLSSSIIKLWDQSEKANSSLIVRKMINYSVDDEEITDKLRTQPVRDKLDVVLRLIKGRNSMAWYNSVCLGLAKLSLQLIYEGCKNYQVRIAEGRLVDEGTIGSLGRNIFIEVATGQLDQKNLEDQLSELIAHVRHYSDNSEIAYILVDIILEMNMQCAAALLNTARQDSTVWAELINSVCDLPSDVASALIRALLPVITQRPWMRKNLLEVTRKHMICPIKISTALPVALLLLKSATEQSSIKPTAELSQSFATFSSQQLNSQLRKKNPDQSIVCQIVGYLQRALNQSYETKILVYKGLTDMVLKNSTFVIQVADLLYGHAQSMPDKLEQLRFVGFDKKLGAVIKHPLPQLLEALGALHRILVKRAYTILSQGNTQMTRDSTELDRKIEGLIQKYMNIALTNDLEDLSLDKYAFAPTVDINQIKKNIKFAEMIVQLYDVLMEYIGMEGEFSKNQDGANLTVKNLLNLAGKKEQVYKLLDESAKEHAKANEKGKKNKNR